MQQLFPLAIRGVLHKDVCAVIVELCSFFKQLGSKVLKTDQLVHFDVMVHLPIHLASEAKVTGLVQY